VNFAAEEQGLVGSLAYTRQTYCAKDDLEAVINLDMIAWNTPGSPRVMNIQANAMQPATLNLANFYQSVVTAYSLGLSPLITSRGTANSDQASFWGYEVPAILAIEDLNDFNPNYHTTDDQLSNLGDLTYFTEMVKASLASLAHLGCLVEDGWGTVTGTITDQHSGLPVANASVAFSNPSWDYLRSTLSQADGSFNLDLVSGLHTLRVDAPGYAPQVISNVNVTQGELTDQDIVLQPQIEWPIFLPLYIRGTVNPPPGCS
jgi:hypothetical protein